MRCVDVLVLVLALAGLSMAAAEKISVKGNQLVNEKGQPLKLRGINYFGFNNGQTMVYRMQLLGFNAVRLPFSFKDFNLKGRTDYIWCREASASEIRRTVSPPGFVPWSKPLPPPRAPLLVGGGRCNIGMPNNVFDRFLWVINYFAKAGFKIVIDNHVWLEDPTAYENPKLWVDSWQKLAAAVSKDPISRGVVMYDLVNEPDNKRIFWTERKGRPSLAKLYFDAMDAIQRPPGLYRRMSDSFGYLSTKGYCGKNKCLKWPVLLGEFSAPHSGAPQDTNAVEGLVKYINNEGDAKDGRHEPINLWFFWTWNNNSPDTNGGIVKENWADIGEGKARSMA
ncbi:hypothetical protein MNEG_1306 [Monoraphidium neglectum]|uniref:Glycoside hydrolase family 5 domain-containing protein n=1 Tax=Monoraphidium neglectum TaxID=145388 RepID=A0A0D2LJY8_9CHLO|nr:hypothetical protein MNEG_1306 [Monoraphidium neglectum]KIZ06654.1 hypothetical protein MNEG_1306 [Monoraphidium neglectum]|eukprot:XP_013905673.1 hypothetical protein MNEG_1306 [Monoraphidium neglectum]